MLCEVAVNVKAVMAVWLYVVSHFLDSNLLVGGSRNAVTGNLNEFNAYCFPSIQRRHNCVTIRVQLQNRNTIILLLWWERSSFLHWQQSSLSPSSWSLDLFVIFTYPFCFGKVFTSHWAISPTLMLFIMHLSMFCPTSPHQRGVGIIWPLFNLIPHPLD